MTSLFTRRGRPVAVALALCTLATGGGAATMTAAQGSTPASATHPAAAKTDAEIIAQVVDANRILSGLGILDSYGHVSARSPTHPDHFFMARSIAPGVVTAADILEYDAQGETVKPTKVRQYLERYLHAAAYKARPEVNAVDHDHSPAVLPFSITHATLRAVTHDAAFMGASTPVFEGDPDGSNGVMQINSMAIGARMMALMGQRPVLLIRGHGEVVVGGSVGEVVSRAVNIDKDSRVLFQALQLGGPIAYITPIETEARAKLAAKRQEFRDWDELRVRYGVSQRPASQPAAK